MRKRGLAFVLAVGALIAIFLLLISDRLIEWGMERAGSAIVGAKVEFDDVDFRLFSASMSWGRLQVTNPQSTMRNMIETGLVEFNISLEPLLLRRFVIQNMQADSVRFNTERATDGALAGTRATNPGAVGRVQELVYDELESLPGYRIADLEEVDIDSIITILSLLTPSVIDSLAEVTDSIYQYWENRFENLPSQEQVDRLETQLESIQTDELESPREIREALEAVQRIASTVDSLQRSLNQVGTQLGSDVEMVGGYDEIVSRVISEDVDRASQIADLPEITSDEVTRVIFGPEIANNLLGILNIIGAARYYGSSVRDEDPPRREEPPRLAGQTIRYTGARNWPKLWIQNISLSAVIAGVFGRGSVQNLSSYQELIGEPITFLISGAGNGRSLELGGMFDYLGEIPKDSVRLNVAGIPLRNIDITSSPIFPFSIENGSGMATGALSFVGDRFLSQADFVGEGLAFATEDTGKATDGQLRTLLDSMLETVSSMSVGMVTEYVENRFSLDLNSDIGGVVAGAVGQALGERIRAFRSEIRNRVDQQVQENRSTLQGRISQLNQVRESFNTRRQQLDSVEEAVQEKIRELRQEAGSGLLRQFQRR